ncbi:MAG: hypothetical protein GY864_01930 [Desulfobacterales bacterium]|nr:hypothetical protein [Desulfobacterales bacterium]
MTNSSNRPPDSIRTSTTQWDSSWPEFAKEDERHSLLAYLEDRFGIPERLFDDYLMFKRRESWSIMKKPPGEGPASQLKVLQTGLKAFHKVGAYIKPTTRFIQIFGHAATKARLEIDESGLLKLFSGDELSVDLPIGDGYVIFSLSENRVPGLGLLIDGKVRSQMPKKEIMQIMLRNN